jgi:hypothetical protein
MQTLMNRSDQIVAATLSLTVGGQATTGSVTEASCLRLKNVAEEARRSISSGCGSSEPDSPSIEGHSSLTEFTWALHLDPDCFSALGIDWRSIILYILRKPEYIIDKSSRR